MIEKEKATRENLLNEIIDREQDMFVAVNANIEGVKKAWCQDTLKTFRQMRYMTHAVLSDDTLASYLEDLKSARKIGRNLVAEKYARMDNLIPTNNESIKIIKIAEIESKWFNALQKEYPRILNHQNQFLNYAISELETYSMTTLELYFKDVLNAELSGVNLVKSRYEILYKRLGFKSLAEVEEIGNKKLQ